MKKDRNIEGSENKAHGRIGVKRIISTLLITVIAVMVLVIGFLFVAPLTETHNGTAVEGSESWMSRIGDDVPISEITLPGTHDSGSEWAMLAFFTKCQSSGIRTQLDEGYRYLDIRLGNEDGSRLSLWHGFCRCRKGFMPWDETLYLEDVLADCYAFLEANPTETVVFCVKQEHGDDLEEMQRILNGKIGERPEMWCLSGSIPALGECRGKIVLLRRYDDVLGLGDDAGIYVGWEDQGGRGEILDAVTEEKDGFTLVIQDRYKYTADEKWIAFL